MKWLEFLWFQREIKKNSNVCQVSVFAFAETKFQCKLLNIKLPVLNSQFHNFYQVKIYPKKMFYKYILLCGAEVLQFNLQNQRKTQAHPSQSTRIEITFSNTTGTLEEQTNFKSCDTLCILSTKHDFAHRQMGREGNIQRHWANGYQLVFWYSRRSVWAKRCLRLTALINDTPRTSQD